MEAGVVERVGTGTQQQVRFNERHPLSPALQQLFEAERARFDRLVNQLGALAKRHASRATAVWLNGGPLPDGTALELGVLGASGEVDAMTDALREAVADLMRSEDVSIEVRGWTRPDVEAIEPRVLPAGGQPILLRGTLPEKLEAGRAATVQRSHAAVDEALRDRAKRVAAVLQRRPELIREARDEVGKRLATAAAPEAKTLREWQQVLDGMSIPRLRRWLVGRSERATRLRQSMPLVFLQAADERAASRERKP